MTYNIKGQSSFIHRNHMRKIGAIIRDANPDVVGLQEVHRRTWQSRFRDQVTEIEESSGLKAQFGPSFGDDSHAYGNAVLTRGAVEESHVEPLPGCGEPRSLLVATIDIGGLKLQAYVTHLVAWARFGARTRLAQATAVAELTARSHLPFVLMGDFNSSPTSDELRVFHDGAIVTSCITGNIVTHRATRQCLDYIFADRGWKILDAQVLRLGPSDHWPLVAELER